MNITLFGVSRGEIEHCGDDSADIVVLQMKVQGTREICESLYNTIEPLHLIGENINMLPRTVLVSGVVELVTQQLKVNDHSVDGILDLVSNTCGESANSAQTTR